MGEPADLALERQREPGATTGGPADAAVEGRLDPRSITVQRIGSAITAVILLVIVVSATARWGASMLAAYAALAALLVWWAYAWPALSYRHTWYRVDAHGIEIWRGVVFRQAISVPRSRVQHTDVSQGPLERRYGLGTLAIHTAGTSHARVQLAGLAHDHAVGLRNRLLPGESGDAV